MLVECVRRKVHDIKKHKGRMLRKCWDLGGVRGTGLKVPGQRLCTGTSQNHKTTPDGFCLSEKKDRPLRSGRFGRKIQISSVL